MLPSLLVEDVEQAFSLAVELALAGVVAGHVEHPPGRVLDEKNRHRHGWSMTVRSWLAFARMT
jgi:hypothetical protein